MAKIYDVMVGRPSEQIQLDKGKKVLIKLHLGDDRTHSCLNSFKEITKKEAQQLTGNDNI